MPFLSRRMVRIRVNGNGIRSAGNPDNEPDFYSMPSVPAEPLQSVHPQQHDSRHHDAAGTLAGYHRDYISDYGGQFANAGV